MKTIIAGGRDYHLTKSDYKFLDTLTITEVVSGGASGADKCGEKYAKFKDIPLKVMPADWSDLSEPCILRYGRYNRVYNALAEHKRNKKMAKYAEAVVLFPGGKGTEDMFKTAKQLGLVIYDRRK